jgi:hypothetical protein
VAKHLNPMTAAERMRRYRARRKASGFKEARRWMPPSHPSVYSDHRLHDIRSLLLHAMVAKKLLHDPQLLAIAGRNLKRWRETRGRSSPALEEWRVILRKPLPELLAFITDMGEDATRLRQSSPFAGVLSPKERKRLFDAFRA